MFVVWTHGTVMRFHLEIGKTKNRISLRSSQMRQPNIVFGLSVLCLSLGLLTGSGSAQEKFGGLTGVVSDPSGAVLPNVMVTVTNKETNRSITATTGADGAYAIRNVEPGRYTVRFER